MNSWSILGLTVAALFFKYVAAVMVQVVDRMRTKSFRHAEDAKLMNTSVGDTPLTARAQHLISNSLELEPFFILLLFVFFSQHVDGQFHTFRDQTDAGMIYASVFVAARLVHGLTFLLSIAGIRSLAYIVSLLSTIGVAVQVITSAL